MGTIQDSEKIILIEKVHNDDMKETKNNIRKKEINGVQEIIKNIINFEIINDT